MTISNAYRPEQLPNYESRQERRTGPRLPAGGIAKLHHRTASGHNAVATVTVRNVSEGGVQVVISRPIPVDQLVLLSGESLECAGLVRYCQPYNADHVVGIRFTAAPSLRGR